MMRRFILLSSILLAWPAYAQEADKKPTVQVELTADEVMGLLRIANIACKSVGLDDGGVVCGFAQTITNKLNAASRQRLPRAPVAP